MIRYQPVSQTQENIVTAQPNSGMADDHLLPSQFRPTIESKSAGSSTAVAIMKET